MLTMLGGFSEEALQLFQHALVEKYYEFSEDGEVYDFTRCQRADGSFYGTSGRCKSGSEAGAKAREATKTTGGRKRRETVDAKNQAKADRKAAGVAKRSATAGRARLLKEELDKVKDKMRGADSETQNRLLREASAAADRRSKEGAKAEPKVGPGRRDKELDRQVVGGQKEAARAKAKLDAEPKKPQAGRPGPEELSRRVAAQEKAEAKPARKPRATTKELGDAQRKLYDEAKALRAKEKEALAEWKRVSMATKADKSAAGRKARLEAGKAADKAAEAARRAENAWQRAHERWSKSGERDNRKKMSPAQRADARRVDKIIKERG
jgi:hypothetical protein